MGKGRVLVVDDEADVRKSVRLILSKAGYDVDEAEDPEAGVAQVKSGANKLPLNAIITDLNMPKINEIIVIPYLRSQFPSCPDHCAKRIKNDGAIRQTVQGRRRGIPRETD